LNIKREALWIDSKLGSGPLASDAVTFLQMASISTDEKVAITAAVQHPENGLVSTIRKGKTLLPYKDPEEAVWAQVVEDKNTIYYKGSGGCFNELE